MLWKAIGLHIKHGGQHSSSQYQVMDLKAAFECTCININRDEIKCVNTACRSINKS